jgi:flavin-dependent dehydrogenase
MSEPHRPQIRSRGRLDLVVVGGGPAGLVTAIAARLAGLSVRVLDRARPPIDKACGEGLMPDAVGLLAALGVELPAESCHRFRGIRYVDGELTAEGLFPQAAGLGVRRPVLHQALARRAAEVGAELCWGAAVVGLVAAGQDGPGGERDADAGTAGAFGGAGALADAGASGETSGSGQEPPPPAGSTPPARQAPRRAEQAGPAAAAGAPPLAGRRSFGRSGDADAAAVRGVLLADGEVVEARWVAGADGLRSRVRQWADLAGPPARHRRFGVRRHYACQPWSDLVEVHWGPGCEAYVTPVGPNEVGVALLWEDEAIPVAAVQRARPGGGSDRGAAEAGGQAGAMDPAVRASGAGADGQPGVAGDGRREDAAGRGREAAGTGAGGQPGTADAGGAAGAEGAAGRVSFDALLAHFPALAERLAGVPVTSRDRGAGPLSQRVRRVWRANVALVGDAAGYLDAITGEGLAVALHQAVALAEALAGGPTPSLAGVPAELPARAAAGMPARATGVTLTRTSAAPAAAGAPFPGGLPSYGRVCRRIGRLPDIMTALVLALERHPRLRRRAFSALAAEPALFSRLLGIHARTLPPAGLGIDGALRLVYRLVTA